MCQPARGRAIAQPDKMIQNGEMGLRQPVGQALLHDGPGQLRDDPYFIEQLEILSVCLCHPPLPLQ